MTLTERDACPLTGCRPGEWPGWRPIETAPKDGTWVLLGWDSGNSPGVIVAYWCPRDAAWLDRAADDYLGPSHWQPLPPPPARAGH